MAFMVKALGFRDVRAPSRPSWNDLPRIDTHHMSRDPLHPSLLPCVTAAKETRGIIRLGTGGWQDYQVDVAMLADRKWPQPGGTYTEFTGIDAAGTNVVGWYKDIAGMNRPFLMTLP